MGYQTSRQRQLKYKYGMTIGDYEHMVKLQKGVCAICSKPPAEGEVFHVDHDHSCCDSNKRTCGRCVRGLLCGPCNKGIGMFGDDIEKMKSAIQYLKLWAE